VNHSITDNGSAGERIELVDEDLEAGLTETSSKTNQDDGCDEAQ
jgi:hypothetical protein